MALVLLPPLFIRTSEPPPDKVRDLPRLRPRTVRPRLPAAPGPQVPALQAADPHPIRATPAPRPHPAWRPGSGQGPPSPERSSPSPGPNELGVQSPRSSSREPRADPGASRASSSDPGRKRSLRGTGLGKGGERVLPRDSEQRAAIHGRWAR